ncbi:endonuclease, partial [Streptomyces sp. TRM76130]|nr:endonuclease [Streptomyces sp. TRM76130]
TGGYRRDALDFAAHLVRSGTVAEARVRRQVRQWWRERSGPVPHSRRPAVRLARVTRRVLLGR